MLRRYPAAPITLLSLFWAADALARGRGYGSGGGGFGIVVGIGAIAAIGYGICWLHSRFPGLGPTLGGLVVIFGISQFVAAVLEDMGVVENEALTTLVLPFLAWGAIALYSTLR